MKKLLLLTACLIGGTCAVHAQSVATLTERDLVGNWQLAAFNSAGVFYDFDTDSLAFSEKDQGAMGSEKRKEFIDNIKSRFQPYKDGSLIISTDHRYVHVLPHKQNAEGTYKLVSKDGKQFVSITCPDNTVEDLQVWRENGRMHFDMPCKETGGKTILIFKKTMPQ